MAETAHITSKYRFPFYCKQFAHNVSFAGEGNSALVHCDMIDWSRCNQWDVVADICCETDNNLASQVAAARSKIAGFSKDWRCVYVLDGGDKASKIGIAYNPINRLMSIQVSCPQQIKIRALLWVFIDAKNVERLALKKARADRKALKGEWVKRDWLDTALLVLESAKELGTKASPSAMWIQNCQAVRDQRETAKSEFVCIGHQPLRPGYIHAAMRNAV